MNEKLREIRFYDFRKENREYAPHLAEENSRIVEGYAIVFNQQSRQLYDKASKKVFTEIIDPRAVTKAFLDDQDGSGAVVCRKEDHSDNSISFSNNAMNARTHMQYHSLSASKPDRHMEPFIIDVAPTDESAYELSSHEGEEFIYVMEGVVEVAYGKKHHVIEAGDSIYYDSIVPHHVHGYNGQAAKILAVVYTPI